PATDHKDRRLLALTSIMGHLPAEYFQYYYFRDEILAELRAKPTTRSQDILAQVPDYWSHYREQATMETPSLDPQRSRGGIHELELAIDVMDAMYNDRREVHPVNLVNHGTIPGIGDDIVVEVQGVVDRHGIATITSAPIPSHLRGLIQQLAEYQSLAADAAWHGNRADGIRALISNPLVQTIDKAENVFNELAAAQRHLLPERLFA
ncbi:MAG: hypothetical protein WKF81_10415, partial [Thermomicrobiales bacterium]